MDTPFTPPPGWPFDRVHVSYLARGGSIISWELSPLFHEPLPHWIEVFVGRTGAATADDWCAIAPPANNVCAVTDPTRRGFGVEATTHYRVRMRTAINDWMSEPVPVTGLLRPRDWSIAQDIVRRARLKFENYGWQGWLLKRRPEDGAPTTPTTPTGPVDPVTGVPTNLAPNADGVSVNANYFAPWPCSVDVSPVTHDLQLDGRLGTLDAPSRQLVGLFPQFPSIVTLDAFIAAGSDRRYYVDDVRDVAEWRGVPLLAECGLRMAPTNDPLYNVPAPQPQAVPVFMR